MTNVDVALRFTVHQVECNGNGSLCDENEQDG